MQAPHLYIYIYKIYKHKQKNIYNLRDENFVKDFNPNIQTTICKQLSCNCMAETNMPKKIIPIYEKNNQ